MRLPLVAHAAFRQTIRVFRARRRLLPPVLVSALLLAACSGPISDAGSDSSPGASSDTTDGTAVAPTVTIRPRSTVNAATARARVDATSQPVGTPLVVDSDTQVLLDALPPVSVFPEQWTQQVQVDPFGVADGTGGSGGRGGACGIAPWAVIDTLVSGDPRATATADRLTAPPGSVVAGMYSVMAGDHGTSVIVLITDLSSAPVDNATQLVMDAYRTQANCEPYEASPGYVVTYSQDDAVVMPGIAADQQWWRSTHQTTGNDMGEFAGHLLIFPVGERLVKITASTLTPATGAATAAPAPAPAPASTPVPAPMPMDLHPLVEAAAASVLHNLSAELPTPTPTPPS